MNPASSGCENDADFCTEHEHEHDFCYDSSDYDSDPAAEDALGPASDAAAGLVLVAVRGRDKASSRTFANPDVGGSDNNPLVPVFVPVVLPLALALRVMYSEVQVDYSSPSHCHREEVAAVKRPQQFQANVSSHRQKADHGHGHDLVH